MTREEAIKILRNEIECLSHDRCSDCPLDKVCDQLKISSDSEYMEAFGIAIEAIEQEPCDKCEVGNPCLYCKHKFEPQEREREND